MAPKALAYLLLHTVFLGIIFVFVYTWCSHSGQYKKAQKDPDSPMNSKQSRVFDLVEGLCPSRSRVGRVESATTLITIIQQICVAHGKTIGSDRER